MTRLQERRFRANPRYDFRLREPSEESTDALPPTPPSDEPAYGYLQPRPSSQLTSRAISPDIALLFLTLRRAGPVPEHFRAAFKGPADTLLLRLVLDGVLEVEHEGVFVSGPDARQLLIGDGNFDGAGPIAKLSVEALLYAEALGDLSVPELTGRLSGFGQRPPTAAQKRMYRSGELAEHGWASANARPALSRYWSLASVNEHWIMWRRLGNAEAGERTRLKLYVSPGFNHVAEAFAATTEVLGQSVGVRALKLGRGLSGVCRPDKLVAYFSRLDDLQAAGANLYRRLEGSSIHGAPFTAELSPDGLLSWGADRTRTAAPGQWESWRFWIASRLAAHLETARNDRGSGPLWRFALDRLRLDGVDPDFWAPTDEFWSSLAVRP